MPNSTIRKSLEQERAQFAYKCVEQVLNNEYEKRYKSYAKKIPMLIKNNGLGATLAFVFSKVEKEIACNLLYRQIGEWLKKREFVNRSSDISSLNNELVAQIISLDLPKYRAATVETLALFNWLRRFVDGLIEGEEEGGDGNDE